MENQTIQTSTYKSLTQIRARKEALKQEIDGEDKKIKELWDRLFHRHDSSESTPSKRFTDMVNTGAGILDALILGWKLYRKFSGSSLFKFRR